MYVVICMRKEVYCTPCVCVCVCVCVCGFLIYVYKRTIESVLYVLLLVGSSCEYEQNMAA